MTERYGCDEWWAPYPGASNYQFSAAGRVRSIDRTISGRFYKGQILAQRPSGRPPGKPPEERYRLVNIRLDDGTRKTVVVHTGMMLARTEGGKRPAGKEVCHNDDHGAHNWFTNLRWDTPEGNRVDRYGEHVRVVRIPNDQPPPVNLESVPAGQESDGFTPDRRHVPWSRRVLAKITRRPVTKRDRTPASNDYAA